MAEVLQLIFQLQHKPTENQLREALKKVFGLEIRVFQEPSDYEGPGIVIEEIFVREAGFKVSVSVLVIFPGAPLFPSELEACRQLAVNLQMEIVISDDRGSPHTWWLIHPDGSVDDVIQQFNEADELIIEQAPRTQIHPPLS